MKFEPRRNQAIGRIVIKRMNDFILRPDESKGTTKFVLIDAVGPKAAENGLKVGDVVLATTISNIMLEGGAVFRALIDEEHVATFIRDVTMADLNIQNENGSKFVSIDDKDAAKSMAVSPEAPASEAA